MYAPNVGAGHVLRQCYNQRMTLHPIPAEKMAAYREGLRRRLNQPLTADERAVLDAARREAQEMAVRLVKQHGARRVILFGSVARQRRLRPDSDIDLAIEGMPTETFYQLVGDLCTAQGRQIDLVRLETARESLRKIIVLEGRVLADDGG